MSAPPRVEPLRLHRLPMLAAALCFAAGILLDRSWHGPLLLATATTALLALSLLVLRLTPRLALLPALCLWIALGVWSAQIQPPIPTQQPLHTYADGLIRTVQGRVSRIRSLPTSHPDTSLPDPTSDDTTEPEDTTPETQSLDLSLSAIEYLTPDTSTLVPIAGGVRITLTGAPIPLACGQLLEVPLRLHPPDTYRTPGAFSYADFLLADGIGLLSTAKSSRLQTLSTPPRPTLPCRLHAAQTWAAARLQSLTTSRSNRRLPRLLRLTPEDASMLNAMLFGDRTHLTHTLRQGFERTGTFHLFVVSGLHVALLAGGLFWLLRRLRLPSGTAVLLTIATATAYALLTGFGVPVQRSLTMASLALIALWLDRETTALNALGIAAFGVLLLDPRALTEASFQMTFLVILAIAGIAAPLHQRLFRPRARSLDHIHLIRVDAHLHPSLAQYRIRVRLACDLAADLLHPRLRNLPVWLLRASNHLAEAILVSIAAEIVMVLPMALYFHRATLLALPTNVLCIPLVAALLCMAILTFLVALLPPLFGFTLAAIPAALTALLLHAVRFAVDHLQRLSLADLRTPAPSPVAITLALLATTLACIALRRPSRAWLLFGLTAAALIPCAVLYPAPALLHPGQLEVTALDVGQGDSLLVVSPLGQTLLVDAGGPTGQFGRQSASHSSNAWDIGDQVVAPYLWSRRIRRLDAVLLTHAHSDHMGGLPAILRDLRPRELWLSVDPGNSPDLTRLLAEAATLHIPIRHLRAGDAFPWSGLSANVLAPEPAYTNPGAPANNDSLVLRLDFDRSSVLLEGDAEAPSEAAMLAHHRLSPVTLLKVGHHGSRSSTTPDFLAALAPQTAIISVGRRNTFGHPRPEILSRLEAAHTRTFRTDRLGTQTLLLSPDGRISSPSTASK